MKQLSSMDLYFLTKEFKVLENQRVDTFYFENDTFYLRVYVSGKGHLLLTSKIGKYIFLGDEKEESGTPSSFVSHLRKYLKGGFIREVEQVEAERILKIIIEKKQGENIVRYHLFVEVFAPGNVIITNSNLEIMNSLKKKKFKDRKVMVREKYELPPKKAVTAFSIEKEKLVEELMASDLSIVKFLAMKLGMGGKFAEEVCFLAGVDKSRAAKEFDGKELSDLIKTIKDLVGRNVEGWEVLDGAGNITDFVPFKFESIKEEQKRMLSFNDVVKKYFSLFREQKDAKQDSLSKDLKKLQNRLEKQQEQMKDIEVDYEKYNSLGNVVYENYALIEELLTSINKAGREKGWDYVLEKIKTDERLAKIVSKLNYKNNEIILEL